MCMRLACACLSLLIARNSASRMETARSWPTPGSARSSLSPSPRRRRCSQSRESRKGKPTRFSLQVRPSPFLLSSARDRALAEGQNALADALSAVVALPAHRPCSGKARPHGLHYRHRVPCAQDRHDHHHDGLKKPRHGPRGRHRDGKHHRAVWRVQDRQVAAVPPARSDVPGESHCVVLSLRTQLP